MRFSRRGFFGFGLGLAAAAAPGKVSQACAQGEAGDVSDDLTRIILTEDSEGGAMVRTTISGYWFEKPAGTRPNPRWAQDNVSFDYAHLTGEPEPADLFAVTAATLATLLNLNSFRTQSKRVLFGLRGCMLAPGNAAKNAVITTRPDHVNPRCIMGVWNTEANTVALFSASTVPGVDLMEKQIQGQLKSNLLPTGLHRYQVGPHRGPRQPGAFLQMTPVWVHRTLKDLIYVSDQPGTEWDDLDGELPFDDLHAAMLSGRKTPPFFSSAGCQVVVGAYDGKVPTGQWAEFRKAAGLAHPPVMLDSQHTKDDGIQFDYVLLTGKDAQIATLGTASGLAAARALRFGSSGELVTALQDKLAATEAGAGLEKTGIIDRKTLGAIIKWQLANKLPQTGLIAHEQAAKLGISFPASVTAQK